MSGFRPILPKANPDPKPSHVTTLASLLPEASTDAETCRLCLSRGNNFVRVLGPYQLGLADLIRQCVSIEIKKTDMLPTVICHQCKTKVVRWSKFRDHCVNANRYLVGVLAEALTNNVTPPVDEDQTADVSSADEEDNKSIEEGIYEDTTMDTTNEDDSADKTESKVTVITADEIFQDVSDARSDDDLRNTDPQQCDVCFKVFTNPLDLLDHQKTHDGQAVFICESCPKTFLHKRDLDKHERNHPMPCPKCNKMIGKLSMKLHMIWHSDKYKCKHCSVRCSSSNLLSAHIKAAHTHVRDHVCETCRRVFATESALDEHRKGHSDQRPYKCKQCTYASLTQSGLSSHMSVHAQDRLQCEACPKVFKSMRNLRDHLRRVHGPEKKKNKHLGAQRGLKVRDKHTLTVHQRSHHTDSRPFSCQLCAKSFSSQQLMKEHMLAHRGERPVVCCDCLKGFSNKRSLREHKCRAMQTFKVVEENLE